MPEKPKASKNKAKDVKIKPRTEESILAEQFGNLQLEIDALLGMARKLQERQNPIRQKLIAIKNKQVKVNG